MKKLLFFLLFLPLVLISQNEELFENANAEYSEGNYEEAINLYEEIIENGQASVAVYYNLGNAYYKLNEVGPSIYYYEKALQLAPNDEDVKNNIEFARSMTLDDIPETEETGLANSINNLVSVFSFNTWAKFAVAFSVFFAVFFLLYYFRQRPMLKRIFFAVAVLMFILSATSVYFAFKQYDIQQNNNFAIIYVEEAEIRDEPTMREESAFELHEGTKAKVLEEYQGWVKIELADGTQGWTSQENLREL